MQEPLLSELSMLGAMEAADQILTGTNVCPPGVDEHTWNFIESLKALSSLSLPGAPTKDITFSNEDFQTFWKKCNKRTSSSISGLHYGHYKAAIDSDYLSELHAIQLQVVVRAGHTLERW